MAQRLLAATRANGISQLNALEEEPELPDLEQGAAKHAVHAVIREGSLLVTNRAAVRGTAEYEDSSSTTCDKAVTGRYCARDYSE